MGWTKGKLRGEPKARFFCENCENEIPFKGYTYDHKFCSNACQGQLKSKVTLERNMKLFEEGKLASRAAIRGVLSATRGYVCEGGCGTSDWQGKKITLQVDHINGDPYNNDPSNLRLLCPNCHSQTETFTSKNKGNGRWSKENLKRYYT
jgi:uncharacterized protein YlaI